MTITCPFCQVVMIENKHGFWHCPDCDAQFRPGPEQVDVWRLEQAYKHSLAKKGGSSKSAGRKREKPKKYWRPGMET